MRFAFVIISDLLFYPNIWNIVLTYTFYIHECVGERVTSFLFYFFLFGVYLQDDTAFEKQSALFALAVSDIVLINM